MCVRAFARLCAWGGVHWLIRQARLVCVRARPCATRTATGGLCPGGGGGRATGGGSVSRDGGHPEPGVAAQPLCPLKDVPRGQRAGQPGQL